MKWIDGSEGTKKGVKESNIAVYKKRQETVESHDHIHHEGAWHINWMDGELWINRDGKVSNIA